MPKCKNDSKKSYTGPSLVQKGVKSKSNGEKAIDEFDKLLTKKYINYGEDMKKFDNLSNKLYSTNKLTIEKIYNRILKNKKQRKQSFNVTSSKMIISDPSYNYPESSKKTILENNIFKVENGSWEGYFHSWITKERPNIAIITNNKYKYPSKKIKYKMAGHVDVDSGQIIIIDANNYPKDDKTMKKWYKNVCKTTEREGGKVDGGYVFHSGWGDGSYNYKVGKINGKVVQFIIYLMP